MAKKYVYLEADGNTESGGAPFDPFFAGSTKSLKRFIMNKKDQTSGNLTIVMLQRGTSDLYQKTAMIVCPNTLSCPYELAASAITGVSSLVAGTKYYYKATALNASGETAGSLEVNVTPDVTNKRVRLSWTQIPGATGYRIYRTLDQNYDGSLLAEVNDGSTVLYIDDGSATVSPTGNLPLENTTFGTAPDYGTAPITGWIPTPSGIPAGPLSIGSLASGRQIAIWFKLMPEITEDDDVNSGFGIKVLESL